MLLQKGLQEHSRNPFICFKNLPLKHCTHNHMCNLARDSYRHNYKLQFQLLRLRIRSF
jgi:hypothetical protein